MVAGPSSQVNQVNEGCFDLLTLASLLIYSANSYVVMRTPVEVPTLGKLITQWKESPQ